MKSLSLVCALGLVGACAKGSAGESPAPPASAPPADSNVPAAKAAPAPAASTTGTTAWKGGYKSVEGTFLLPKEVKWKVPESNAGLGDGSMTLAVDRATGRVQGILDGALGPATIDGVAGGGKLTATVSRVDPSDHGFTGTLQGALGEATAQGTMNMTQADVTAVRNATFELAPVR
jgi:hypothetical protein